MASPARSTRNGGHKHDPHDPRFPRPEELKPDAPLPSIFEEIAAKKFTGRVVLHCLAGFPRTVDVGVLYRRFVILPEDLRRKTP